MVTSFLIPKSQDLGTEPDTHIVHIQRVDGGSDHGDDKNASDEEDDKVDEQVVKKKPSALKKAAKSRNRKKESSSFLKPLSTITKEEADEVLKTLPSRVFGTLTNALAVAKQSKNLVVLHGPQFPSGPEPVFRLLSNKGCGAMLLTDTDLAKGLEVVNSATNQQKQALFGIEYIITLNLVGTPKKFKQGGILLNSAYLLIFVPIKGGQKQEITVNSHAKLTTSWTSRYVSRPEHKAAKSCKFYRHFSLLVYKDIFEVFLPKGGIVIELGTEYCSALLACVKLKLLYYGVSMNSKQHTFINEILPLQLRALVEYPKMKEFLQLKFPAVSSSNVKVISTPPKVTKATASSPQSGNKDTSTKPGASTAKPTKKVDLREIHESFSSESDDSSAASSSESEDEEEESESESEQKRSSKHKGKTEKRKSKEVVSDESDASSRRKKVKKH